MDRSFVNVRTENDRLGVLSRNSIGSGVCEEVAAEDWQQMSELICQTPASNHGFIGFFFDDYEILPQNVHGRFYFNTAGQPIENLEPSCKARAVLESQCLAKRLYLQRANIDLVHDVNQIVITGRTNMSRRDTRTSFFRF